MAAGDFAISAKVHRLLKRRWLRAEQLQVGVTEGVVLLRGRLGAEAAGVDLDDPAVRGRFLGRLRRDLLSVSGVTEVVLDVGGAEDGGGRWIGTGS